jgi:pimeloyl-ACP methyl ester carboxylesterase
VSAAPETLFLHGGGDQAYACDRAIVDRLRHELGPDMPIRYPHIEGLEALDWPAVESQLGDVLRALPAGSIVVAHSLGASAMLKLLSGGLDPKLRHLFLLAAPYNGTDGEWGDGAFAFPVDFARHLPGSLPITLWHGRDDEIMPAAHAERYRRKLSRAQVILLDGHGHQFEGSLKFLADAIRGAMQ